MLGTSLQLIERRGYPADRERRVESGAGTEVHLEPIVVAPAIKRAVGAFHRTGEIVAERDGGRVGSEIGILRRVRRRAVGRGAVAHLPLVVLPPAPQHVLDVDSARVVTGRVHGPPLTTGRAAFDPQRIRLAAREGAKGDTELAVRVVAPAVEITVAVDRARVIESGGERRPIRRDMD